MECEPVEEHIIIGRNTVREAIKSGREIDCLYVAKGQNDGSIREILALARKRGVIIKEAPRSKLDELSMPFGYGGKTGNHQGLAAMLPSIQYAGIEDIFAKAEAAGAPPFIIALDGITDPQNLGSIVRSAEVLGAHGVIIGKRRSAAMTAVACKVASGAEEYIPIAKVSNLAQAIEEVKKRGVWVAAADMDGKPAAETDLAGPLMLVVGAEGAGVSRIVREHSDYVVCIPVLGNVGSLNAATAAAILMYEKKRQENG